MLFEMAFVPQSLAPTTAEERATLVECLSGLISGINRLGDNRARLAVADLCDAQWFKSIKNQLDNAKSDPLSATFADRLADFIQCVEDRLVWRPCVPVAGDPTPERWIRSARADPAVSELIGPDNDAGCAHWSKLQKNEWWDVLNSVKPPKNMVESQLKWLERYLAHADWVAVLDPYIYWDFKNQRPGGGLPFIIELLKFVMKRRPRWAKRFDRVEIHTVLPKAQRDVKEFREKQIPEIERGVIKEIGRASFRLLWKIWNPRFKDRVLLAGIGEAIRWGVSMPHTADPGRDSDDPVEFRLLNDTSTSYWSSCVLNTSNRKCLEEGIL